MTPATAFLTDIETQITNNTRKHQIRHHSKFHHIDFQHKKQTFDQLQERAMKYQALNAKRQFIANRFVIGFDPGKKKHQAVALDPQGLQLRTFTFAVSNAGFRQELWNKMAGAIPTAALPEVVFAIETACNLWQTLAHYLHSQGYKVVLVSPLTVSRSRPMINHDFSRTDPKDGLLVASNTRDGYFDFYHVYSPTVSAMHDLSIAYNKLRKNMLQQRARVRSCLDRVFPEFFDVVDLDTATARHLLRDYFLPEHYLQLDLDKVGQEIAKISQYQYGIDSLKRLQELARTTIGIPKQGAEVMVVRSVVNAWLTLEKQFQTPMEDTLALLVGLARQIPAFELLTSLKGINETLAALFLAETLDLSFYRHYKQIEKLAGYNLKQSQSGQYVGSRRISHLGNRRLSWILYWMTQEAVKYVPEVRIKFLTRQLVKRCFRKNVVACVPVMLKLIFKIVKEQRPYEYKPESLARLQQLEQEYQAKYQPKTKKAKNTTKRKLAA
jgi:transposase